MKDLQISGLFQWLGILQFLAGIQDKMNPGGQFYGLNIVLNRDKLNRFEGKLQGCLIRHL